MKKYFWPKTEKAEND